MLLAHITQEDLEIVSFDVRTAFLYGEFEEEIYMEIPEGVDVVNNEVSVQEKIVKMRDKSDVVCLLQKSLYGLKQAPRCWNYKFKQFLYKFGCKEIDADKCIFVGKYNQHIVYIALFVDDGLVACKSREVIDIIMSNT